MGIFKKTKIQKDKENNLIDFIDTLINAKNSQLLIKKHAIEHAVDIIAKTISKSEIKVYKTVSNKIKSVKDETYYTLNVRPNDNEEATSFFYNVIKKYLEDEDALIVCMDKKLYLADDYNQSYNILIPKTYNNVRLSDEQNNSIILKKSFSNEDVIHLSLKKSEIKETLDDYYTELGKLIGLASMKYKLINSNKFRLKIPGGQPKLKDPTTGEEMDYENFKKKLLKGLFDEEDSIILLSDVFELEKINLGNSPDNSNEWSNLEKKWSDKVAMSFNIPLDIFYGNKTDKSTSTTDFLTFGVLPHLQILEDGFNSKIIDKEDYLKGECIKINRLNMVHKDILDSASSMDKLFSNGYTHNEINEIVGLPPVDEPWANKSYITKNYINADLSMKGGDEV